jgi:hypothetical protein
MSTSEELTGVTFDKIEETNDGIHNPLLIAWSTLTLLSLDIQLSQYYL